MKLRSVLAPYWRETISTRVRSIKVKTIGIWIPIVIVHIVGTAYAQESGPRLWITDDTTRTVYEVMLYGELISSFPDNDLPPFNLKKANSGIALDPSNDTLWGASEQTVALPRGSIVNFSKDGVLLSQIPTTVYGACAVEGVAIDYFDDSIWFVDDPIADGDCPAPQIPTVYHISKDGTLIDSFPTSTFAASSDPSISPFNAALSPQAIAMDPFDGTLWVTDNSDRDMVYNIDRDGTQISFFPVKDYNPAASRNPQGISVDDSDRTLWVTDRTSHTIYNIPRNPSGGDCPGTGCLTSFDSKDYDMASENPTGVAFDWRAGMTRLRGVIDNLQTVVDFVDTDPGVSGDDLIDRDIIEEAIVHIEKSLKRKQWLDWATPNPKTKVGGKIIDEIKKAVAGGKDSGGLIRVLNINDKTDVYDAIDALVDIPYELAIAAKNWATDERDMACLDDPSSDACTDANKKIAESDKKLVEAQKELDKGDIKRAIAKIKDAWKKAREAIQKANPENTKPEANPVMLTTAIGQPLWFQLTGFDPDGDDLWFVPDKQPGHGTMVLNGLSGRGLYTPDPGFQGIDMFNVRANDGILESDKREVQFEVGN